MGFTCSGWASWRRTSWRQFGQDGNKVPMFNLFNGAPRVTQAVDVGRPLTPQGKVVGTFADSVTFQIKARGGDRLSLATMLICTNDGFTGVDGVKLPEKGSLVLLTNGSDAGRENNTEKQPRRLYAVQHEPLRAADEWLERFRHFRTQPPGGAGDRAGKRQA